MVVQVTPLSLVLPGGLVQSSYVTVNCLKEISGTTPLRGRWIIFLAGCIPWFAWFSCQGSAQAGQEGQSNDTRRHLFLDVPS